MHMITMTSDWLWDRRYFVPTRHFVNYTITSTQLVNIPSLPDTWTFLENFDGDTPTVSFKAPSTPARGRGGKPLREPSWKSVGGGGGEACTWGREGKGLLEWKERRGEGERRERIVRVKINEGGGREGKGLLEWNERRKGERREKKEKRREKDKMKRTSK